MEELTAYFWSNSSVMIPFIILILEVFLRKIPTFENFSLMYHITRLLDALVPNQAKIKGTMSNYKGKFLTRQFRNVVEDLHYNLEKLNEKEKSTD